MWPFRRRQPKGDLGAAVTGIPSLTPYVVPVPAQHLSAAEPVAVPAAEPVAVPVAVPVVAPVAAEPALAAPAPVVESFVPTLSVLAVGPRVELGFRDGSTASFAPGSDQARALTDLASILTQRD